MSKTDQLLVLQSGESLFKQGDKSDFIYQVIKGKLQVFSNEQDDEQYFGEVLYGEYVGEMGVLQQTRRNANVRASETTELVVYTLEQFIENIFSDKEQSQKLLHSLSYRICNVATLSDDIAKQIAEHKSTLNINPLILLANVGSNIFNYLRKLIYKREQARYQIAPPEVLPNGEYKIRKGRALFLQGQASNFACLVLKGKFKARKSIHDSHQHITKISAGEFIGEMGLLQSSPRNLTVVATTDAIVEIMDEIAFFNYVNKDRKIFSALMQSLCQRAAVLNKHLNDLTRQYKDIINPTTVNQTKRLFQHMGHLSQVTGEMIEQDLYALQTAMVLEANAVQDMLDTYYRYINGQASQEEMDQANADFRNFLKTLGLGIMIVIPGSFITIPLIVKLGKSFGIDVLPRVRS